MSRPTEPIVDTAQHSGPIEGQIRALTETIGARVRTARELRSLSRRELSEMSGVSQRYLAQIEAGEGNISISLLMKVGHALGHDIAWFVGTDAPTPDKAGVATLFDKAGPDQRRAVMEILAPAPKSRAQRIALIGLRGAGKSTLGRRAARALSIPFVELNTRIEAESGMTVGDVMALYGPEGYRSLERQALKQVLASEENVIIAVAGGIVSAPETFDMLLEGAHTIWLRASPQEHMDRVIAQGDERPMAGNPAALDELKAILQRREALYARAPVQVDTSTPTEFEALQRLIAAIRENRFLKET